MNKGLVVGLLPENETSPSPVSNARRSSLLATATQKVELKHAPVVMINGPEIIGLSSMMVRQRRANALNPGNDLGGPAVAAKMAVALGPRLPRDKVVKTQIAPPASVLDQMDRIGHHSVTPVRTGSPSVIPLVTASALTIQRLVIVGTLP